MHNRKNSLSVKAKVARCLIAESYKGETQFNYDHFYNKVIISYYDKVGCYSEALFSYGCMKYLSYNVATSIENLDKYESEDALYMKWKFLCVQLILLIEREKTDEGQKFYSTDNEGRNRHEIIDSTGKPNMISHLIIEHLKQGLCDFQNEHRSENQDLTNVSEIDLAYLKDSLECSKQDELSNVGISKGRQMDVGSLISHRCIQELSFLLRIDELLTSKDTELVIGDIDLTTNDYQFIASFLDYFGLLFYESSNTVTTKAGDIIKARYRDFPKANLPNNLRYVYKNMGNNINNLAKHVKIND